MERKINSISIKQLVDEYVSLVKKIESEKIKTDYDGEKLREAFETSSVVEDDYTIIDCNKFWEKYG